MKLKSTSRVGAAVLVALALSSAANAAFITGLISFNGEATLDGPLATATKVTAWTDVTADVPITGDFATYVTTGDAATFTSPWSFTSGAVTPLWQVDGFTFDLTSSSVLFQNQFGLLVTGSGTVSGHSFDPTAGTWFFSTQPGANNNFRFSASTSAVPDGGTTMALLGLSLLGLQGIRRKFSHH